MRDALDVAAVDGVGVVEALCGTKGQRAKANQQQTEESQADQYRGKALTLDGLDEGIGGIHADQHEHEQEQHHDGAGVDHDLRHA